MLTLTLINILVVGLVVILHYEVLLGLSRKLPYLHYKNKYQIVIGVFGALIAHCIEIWIFALGYYYMFKSERFGHLEGNFDGSLLELRLLFIYEFHYGLVLVILPRMEPFVSLLVLNR